MKISSYQQESYINNIENQKIIGCLLFGPEKSLIDFYGKKIFNKIIKGNPDPFLVTNINQEAINNNPSLISDEFFSISMMGGRKLIIIDANDNEVTKSLDSIISEINDKIDDTNFILIKAGDLNKTNALRKLCENSKIIAAIGCYEESDFTAKKYISDCLKAKKINFNNDIVEIIFEKTGRVRDLIAFEIGKIDLYLDKERNLSIGDANKILSNQSQISVDEFINNFVEEKYDKATVIAKKLFENNYNSITLIRYLQNYLQKLEDAKTEIEKNNIDVNAAIKKQFIFFKQEPAFKKHLQQKTLKSIKQQIFQLQDSEIHIKKGLKTNEFIFYNFLLNST